MRKPFYSIVMPTRDRPDTLHIALKALCAQQCDEVEFVIQDNASGPDTRAIVKSFSDPRIVYRRSKKRLSMRANFEEGVAATRGEYITIIGDDDAFCAGAIQWLVDFLKEQRPDGIRWSLIAYFWPNMTHQNLGLFWPRIETYHAGWRWKKTSALAQSILNGKIAGAEESLLIYHGALSRHVYDAMKAQTGGTFFQYHVPDVYVHLTMPFIKGPNIKGKYIHLEHPLTVYGLSGHSSGQSWYVADAEKRGKNSPVEKWRREGESDDKVAMSLQKAIRSLHYHSLAALTLAAKLGVIDPRTIKVEAWLKKIQLEVRASPFQLAGYLESEPVYDFDEALFKRLRKEHAAVLDNPPKAPSRLRDIQNDWASWHQLPLKFVWPHLADDVDGAVVAASEFLDNSIGLLPAKRISASSIAEARIRMRTQLRLLCDRSIEQTSFVKNVLAGSPEMLGKLQNNSTYNVPSLGQNGVDAGREGAVTDASPLVLRTVSRSNLGTGLLISVVIPTRDRPDTLKVCLEALRKQNCADIEIVVQDNASGPLTRKVVEEASKFDGRIVYFRSEKRLSQRHNFEVGLANTRGSYMSIIGDDDAFCRGTLQWLCDMARFHQPDCIRWGTTAYIWPSLCDQNIGLFSFDFNNIHGGWKKQPRQLCADRIARAEVNSWDNLMVYHGLISRRMYETITSRSGGTFFGYHLPDVYAHNVMAFVKGPGLSNDYIDVRHPISIYGMSGHSSGASWRVGTASSSSSASPGQRWEEEVLEDPLSHVPWQTPVRTMHYHDYVALMIGQDLGLLEGTQIDEEAWIESIVNEIAANPWQITGFMEGKKLYPFDEKVFDRVLTTHSSMTKSPAAPPPPTYALLEPWWLYQKTCIKAVLPNANDDVSGAVDALDSLLKGNSIPMRSNFFTRPIMNLKRRQFKTELRSVYDSHKLNGGSL